MGSPILERSEKRERKQSQIIRAAAEKKKFKEGHKRIQITALKA